MNIRKNMNNYKKRESTFSVARQSQPRKERRHVLQAELFGAEMVERDPTQKHEALARTFFLKKHDDLHVVVLHLYGVARGICIRRALYLDIQNISRTIKLIDDRILYFAQIQNEHRQKKDDAQRKGDKKQMFASRGETEQRHRADKNHRLGKQEQLFQPFDKF